MADDRSDAHELPRVEHEPAGFNGRATSLLPIQSAAYGVPSMPPSAYTVPSMPPAYAVPSSVSAYSLPLTLRAPAHSVPSSVPIATLQRDSERQFQEANLMQQAAHAYNTARYEQALSLAARVTGKYAKMAEIARAVTLGELARYDECLFAFAVYLADNAEDAMVWSSYAYFLSTLDQQDLGMRAYQRALELVDAGLERAPTDASLWSQRAYALLGLWRAEEALCAARMGLELDESDPLLNQHRGRAHLYLAQLEEAKAWLGKAIALDAHDPYAHFYLTKVLIKLGDPQGAEPHLAYIGSVSPHLTAISRSDF